MRVFVAGASGAIGRQLVPLLVAAGHEVSPMVTDALDPDQVAQAVAIAGPDVIVHQLTAIVAIDARHIDRFPLVDRLRTESTDYLLSAGQAVGVRRFVAQSSGAFPYPVGSIRYLEQTVLSARWTEGIVLRYGPFIHVVDAAVATLAAVDHGTRGIYTVASPRCRQGVAAA
jgi:nucleoside-diphosphate-sugar epimerase